MNTPSPHIQALTAELASTRASLHSSVSGLEQSLDIKQRVKSNLSENPLKWSLMAVATGFLASKAVPLLFRLGRHTITSNVISGIIKGVLPLAAIATQSYFENRHRP